MKKALAETLLEAVFTAQTKKRAIDKLTKTIYPELNLADAYLIQEALVKRKVAQGEKIIGLKMGLTSMAKLSQMKVTEPIYGYLFDTMQINEGGTIELENFIHPKVEPELGFVLAEPLSGSQVTKEEVIAKTAFIFPAIEIIDSRYHHFDFTIPDVVADNTSAAGAVFGNQINSLVGMDLATVGAVLSINGRMQTSGTGADVLGHPAESIARLARMLAQKGETIPANQPILTGGMTAAVSLKKGDFVQVEFGGDLGATHFYVAD